jgi:hypothetical protein
VTLQGDRLFKSYVNAVSEMLDDLRIAHHHADQHKIELAFNRLYVHNCAMREQLGLGPYTHQPREETQ